MRRRTLAVDARVGPEVDEDDLALQRTQRDRRTVRSVEPLLRTTELRRRTARGELGRTRRTFRQLFPTDSDRRSKRTLHGLVLRDLLLQSARVAGQRPLDH